MIAGAREHVLALADDEHLMGQGHTEWIGVAPFLEEDLAFCSIAQDELGHAALLYELLADDGDADALAFRRGPDDHRSCHLVELPCDDWADALARHWLYDAAEQLRWRALAASTEQDLAALVERVEREEVYHRRHAETLVARLLDTPAGAGRLRAAIDWLLPYADAVWEPVAGEAEAVAAGVATAGSAELQSVWRSQVVTMIGGPIEWDRLDRPQQHARTVRSAHFAAIHERINEVFSIDPAAHW